jgi:hypothetical protein
LFFLMLPLVAALLNAVGISTYDEDEHDAAEVEHRVPPAAPQRPLPDRDLDNEAYWDEQMRRLEMEEGR